MAASGVMADFARMPAQKKAMVFVVAGVLLGALYWHFVWKSLNLSVEAAQNENAQQASLNTKLAADIPKYEELKSRVKELELNIAENQKALPTEAEVPAFFETLERKVKESGVEIAKWLKLTEEPVEGFVRVPVAIEISGTFIQIKRFFASLVHKGVSVPTDGQVEERERIISIEDLSLTNPVVKNRELVLTAKFIAVTFRQEDQAAGTVKPTTVKAPKPASPGSSSGTAPPSATPAPGAATPAGAKARTEQAIDKRDQVNRNATSVDEAKSPGDGSARLKGGI